MHLSSVRRSWYRVCIQLLKYCSKIFLVSCFHPCFRLTKMCSLQLKKQERRLVRQRRKSQTRLGGLLVLLFFFHCKSFALWYQEFLACVRNSCMPAFLFAQSDWTCKVSVLQISSGLFIITQLGFSRPLKLLQAVEWYAAFHSFMLYFTGAFKLHYLQIFLFLFFIFFLRYGCKNR